MAVIIRDYGGLDEKTQSFVTFAIGVSGWRWVEPIADPLAAAVASVSTAIDLNKNDKDIERKRSYYRPDATDQTRRVVVFIDCQLRRLK